VESQVTLQAVHAANTVAIMNRNFYARLQDEFVQHMAVLWANLSRLTNVLIIINLSMFFLTGAVTRYGFYYTFYSLFCLGLVAIGLVLPTGLHGRLWYYLVMIVLEGIAIYLVIVSGWYWVKIMKVAT
jgi:hypothetical protein